MISVAIFNNEHSICDQLNGLSFTYTCDFDIRKLVLKGDYGSFKLFADSKFISLDFFSKNINVIYFKSPIRCFSLEENISETYSDNVVDTSANNNLNALLHYQNSQCDNLYIDTKNAIDLLNSLNDSITKTKAAHITNAEVDYKIKKIKEKFA